MTEDAKADSAPLPQSVKKLAAAKAKAPAKTKKPSVNIAQLERSLKEARVALSEETKGKEELLADLQQKTEEIRRLNRTITRLNEVIADYKAKEVKRIRGRFGWFRRSK